MRVKKYDHITPVLAELHWLPVSYRIIFKVLLLTFKALHQMAPSYICDLLVPHQPTRTLRSSDASFLVIPRSKLRTCGDRSFSVAAPKYWNDLPGQLRNCHNLSCFKAGLKTYLFRKAYLNQ